MFNSFGEFLQRILEFGLECTGLYYSVYRAKVINSSDPDSLGRLILHCEQVHGPSYPEVWAWPETPYAGNGFGFWAIPDVGEYVYVRFDHGRPDHPIWHGGFWGEDDITDEDMTPKKVVLLTKEGMKIVMDRENQTLLMEQTLGNSVFISDDILALKHVNKILVDGQDVTVQSMGTTEVRAQGTCLVEALDEVSITSAGKCRIDGAESVDIGSTSYVNIHSAGAIDLTSDQPISLNSAVSISLVAPVIDVTGNGTVTGNWFATLNSAHHTHPVAGSLASAGNP